MDKRTAHEFGGESTAVLDTYACNDSFDGGSIAMYSCADISRTPPGSNVPVWSVVCVLIDFAEFFISVELMPRVGVARLWSTLSGVVRMSRQVLLHIALVCDVISNHNP